MENTLKDSIVLKIINARLGCSKDYLAKLSKVNFKIKFTLRNQTNQIKEIKHSKEIALKDSLMFFNQDEIAFNDVVIKNDSIEICFVTISNNEIDTEYKPIKIYLRELDKGIERDDVWTLPMQSLINLKYTIKDCCSLNIEVKKKEDLYKRLNNPFKISKEDKANFRIGAPLSPQKQPRGNKVLSPKKIDLHYKETMASMSALNLNSIPKSNNQNTITLMSTIQNSASPHKIFPDQPVKAKDKDNISYEILESNQSTFNIDEIYSSDYISKLNYTEIDYDTFCHCVFISGLSNTNTDLLPQSEEFPSPCHHKECSILSSFKPNVLFKYQNSKKKYQLDITDDTATLCFPLGIKLCYKSTIQNKELPRPYKPFLNVIKNEKGEMYFMISLHYFKRIEIEDYDKKYKLNPLKEYTRVLNADKIESNQDKFASNLQIISSFIATETVYIPECITLVSRFPFFRQMSTCLQTIFSLNDNDRKPLIGHLINEIPIPIKEKQILFYLPYNATPIELQSPFKPNSKDFAKQIIFKHLTTENICFICNLILNEQKILFIENDYSVLSSISFAFISLIYPFCWMNTFIPVLSLSTVTILQSIIPFIMGIDEFLFKFAIDQEYIDDNSKIVYIDIKSNSIFLSPITKKQLSKKHITKEMGIPELPKMISSFLSSNLKEAKKLMKTTKNDKSNLNDSIEEKLNEIFCETISRIIGDYKPNMFITDNEAPLFNSECYLDKKDKEDKKYYQELIQNQLFNQFLFNEKEINFREKNLMTNHNNRYGIVRDNYLIDTSYYHMVYDNYIASVISKNKKSKSKTKSAIKEVKSRPHSITRSSSCNKKDRDYKNNSNIKQSKNQNSSLLNDNSENNSNIMSHPKNDNSVLQLSYISTRVTFKIEKNEKTISHNENNSKQSSLIISPYFIDNPSITSSKNKIEEHILNEIKKRQNAPIDYSSFNCIIPESESMSFDNIIDSYRRYFFSNDKRHRSKSTLKEIKSSLTSSNPFKALRRKSISTNNLLDTIKNPSDTESISDWFTNICTTDMKNRFKLIDISSLMQSEANRTFFANLINQNKKIQDKTSKNSYKTLNASCFNELMKSIKSALGYCGLNEHQTGRSLTIACFLYFKVVNKVNVFIYEEYVKTFKPCRQWLSSEFWVNWFDYDMTQIEHANSEDDRSNDSERESDNDNNNDDKVDKTTEEFPSQWKILLRLERTMAKLKMKKEFIKQVIINQLAMNHLEHEYLVQYQEEFIIRRDY